MFGLVDCNNFFVSCEKVFRPDLEGKPVMVLSNNDGCVVSRSNEVKKLGIPMAAPVYKFKELIKQHNIQVFSANFQLYGDLSRRVMETLKHFTLDMQIYSIDEAFLALDSLKYHDLSEFGSEIRNTVLKWTGIPVSIGIAATKTLAKAANEIAKQDERFNGVLNLSERQDTDQLLVQLDISDIWGVGRGFTKKLRAYGIQNALQLKSIPDSWVKKHMSITGMRTIMELRGTKCIKMHNAPHIRKSVVTSRSFGHNVTSLSELEEAIASYICRAAEKLRQEKMTANHITVFIFTNKYKQHLPQYIGNHSISLPQATAFNPDLIKYALQALRKIYKRGYQYKKAGVLLTSLVPEHDIQYNLFNNTEIQFQHERKLMQTVDKINNTFGKRTVRYAATGIKKPWHLKQEHRSSRYTTKWNELLTVKI